MSTASDQPGSARKGYPPEQVLVAFVILAGFMVKDLYGHSYLKKLHIHRLFNKTCSHLLTILSIVIK